MYGGFSRSGPKWTREQVVVYFLNHCRACGHEEDDLIEFHSRIVGTVGICRPCAARAGLHDPILKARQEAGG